MSDQAAVAAEIAFALWWPDVALVFLVEALDTEDAGGLRLLPLGARPARPT